MTHLGLDLSLTATGWAEISARGSTFVGTFGDTTDNHVSLRLRRWASHLNDVIPNTCNGLHIVIEDLPRNARFGGVALGMVHAMFWKTLAERAIPYEHVTTVPPSSLKLYATGKGNASKEEMLVSAVRRLGYEGHDHNAADALWLADLGARIDGFDRPALPATHLKALDKIRPKEAATNH